MRLAKAGALAGDSSSGARPRLRRCALMRWGMCSGSSRSGSSTSSRPSGQGTVLGGGDEFGDGPDGAGERPLVDALADEPHAVDVFVEADAVADGAEVGEVLGLGGGVVAGLLDERADQRPGAGADVGPVVAGGGDAGDGGGGVVAGGRDEGGVGEGGQFGERAGELADVRAGRDELGGAGEVEVRGS